MPVRISPRAAVVAALAILFVALFVQSAAATDPRELAAGNPEAKAAPTV